MTNKERAMSAINGCDHNTRWIKVCIPCIEQAIAEAVQAETDRCTKVAERHPSFVAGFDPRPACECYKTISAAIRSGEGK